MSLYKGSKNIGKNISTEMAHGKSHDQAVAIAMRVAGKQKPATMNVKHKVMLDRAEG